MLLVCGCQVLTEVEEDGGVIRDGGGGGGTAGSGGGGGGGGGSGGGCLTCTASSCGVGCGGDLCRSGSGLSCDGGVCALPRPPLATGDLVAVFGSGPNDVWVAEDGQRAFHWNGSAWGCLPALPVNNDVWSSRDEAWFAGRDGGAPLLRFRWDGGSTHFDGAASGLNLQTLHSVWGDGSGAIWGSGVGTVVAVTAQGQVTRDTFSPASVCRDLKGLPGAPPVLAACGNGNVFRADGGAWVRESTGAVQMRGVFPQANGEDFALDGVGQVKRRVAASWGDDGPPLTGNGTALGGGGGELYASVDLGTVGTLFRRDPSLGWQEVLRTGAALRDVWVAPDRSVFLVGNAGTALRYQPPDCTYPTVPIADEFNTPLDAGRWAVYNGNWQTTGGQLIGGGDATDSSTGVRATLARPGLVNAALAVEVVQVAQMNGTDVDVGTLLVAYYSGDSGATTLKIELSNGQMKAYAGDPRAVLGQRPQPTGGGARFLRIREQGGTLSFEAASATGTLQTFYADAGFDFLPLIDTVQLGIFKNPGTLSRPAIFDHLNRCPRP